MNELLRVYDNLSDRSGFNEALLHFQSVMDVISDFEDGYNLADILNSLVNSGDLKQEQVQSVIAALLVDKYGYFTVSANLENTTRDFSFIKDELKSLKAFDAVISYYHPELGYLVINPKNPDSWKVTNELRRNEFIIIHIGAFAAGIEKISKPEAAAKKLLDILNGKKTRLPDALKKGKYRLKAYIPFEEDDEDEEDDYYEDEPDSSDAYEEDESDDEERTEPSLGTGNGGPQKMTPFYSVPVTNELFHNGNVEAWKRIIQSYTTKNPGLEVHIFYEGERILNIASLFKWGKVKHGSAIMFAVAGDDIKDVAKLQKYLKQGASHQFEAFLKFPVNTVLNLF